jgi:hypothetical protein
MADTFFDDPENDLSGVTESLLGLAGVHDTEIAAVVSKAGIVPNAANKAAIKKLVNKAAISGAVNGKITTKTQAIAITRLGDLPKEQQEMARDGKLTWSEADLFVRAQVAGMTELLTSNTKELNGISRWVGNTLGASDAAVWIDRIDVAYGSSATTITNPGDVKYGNDAAAVPAGILNGELEFMIKGKAVFRVRMSRFFGEPAGTMQQSQREKSSPGVALQAPKLIVKDVAVKINFYPADQVTLPTTVKHWLEVSLLGQQTQARIA